MDLWQAGWLAATTAVASEAAKGPPWWAIEILKLVASVLATGAGVWIGAWLVTRREAAVRNEKRAADTLYLAVTVSGILEQFVSECASVASDDGTYNGQLTPDGRLQIQVKMPALALSNLDVEWRSLEGALLDQIHSVPRKLAMLVEYLAFAEDNYDEYEYFADRQRKSAELGLYAANVSSSLRISAGLTALIDPQSTTVTCLKQTLEDRISIDNRRAQARDEMWNELSGISPASSV